MAVLLLAEHDHNVLQESTYKLVSAAKAFQAPIHLLVAGSGCHSVAEMAARIEQVRKVLLVDAPHYAHPLAESMADLLMEILQAENCPYNVLLASASTFGKNILPRVAALQDVMQVSDVTRILSPKVMERPIYAGNAFQTVEVQDSFIVATIRTSAFQKCGEAGEGVPIEKWTSVPPDKGLSEFQSETAVVSERPDLASAKIVVAGGRAFQSAENFQAYLLPVADQLKAAVGASRAAVDAGYAPNDWQVGQTGKIVAPDLYIALGISGAIQHLAGMKSSKVIVAINKDPEAPIFQIADYGLVGDVFQVLTELRELLKENV